MKKMELSFRLLTMKGSEMEDTRKIEIFVSNKCPHCKAIIEDYGQNPEKYEGIEVIDINENMYSLKRFLRYRDDLPGYDEVKAAGKVGVPSKVIDGKEVEFFDQV